MQPSEPESLPIAALNWEGLIPALAAANRALAHYDGALLALRNPEILLAPLTTQEAVLSSRIEGTQATFGEVLRAEAGEAPGKPSLELDVFEIVNYRRALRQAERELGSRPFSLNLLKSLHATLLDSVRGANKARGEIRKIQNWIGRPDTPIEAADFVPPGPPGLPRHLDAWERYYHAEAPDALVQLAVIHGQFEFLHPFLDGNGRLGRMLIPLFLYEKKLLTRPVFYLSGYLERHRETYIGRLRALGREAGAWQSWCGFFLEAVAAQAQANAAQVRRVQELYESYKQRAVELTHSEFAVMVVDAIFERPIFSTSQVAERPHMPTRATVGGLLGRLAGGGMLSLVRQGSGRRAQIWSCDELFALCNG